MDGIWELMWIVSGRGGRTLSDESEGYSPVLQGRKRLPSNEEEGKGDPESCHVMETSGWGWGVAKREQTEGGPRRV